MIFKLNLKKYKGIWFFGFSGSGKTYISKILKNRIKSSVVIDGDNVRKLISYDLGYSKQDRKIQINRVFGISKLIIESGKFPIISTVYMNKKVNDLCIKNKILSLMVIRKNFFKIKKNYKIYNHKSNVVGKDIFFDNFKKLKLINDNTPFILKLNK